MGASLYVCISSYGRQVSSRITLIVDRPPSLKHMIVLARSAPVTGGGHSSGSAFSGGLAQHNMPVPLPSFGWVRRD